MTEITPTCKWPEPWKKPCPECDGSGKHRHVPQCYMSGQIEGGALVCSRDVCSACCLSGLLRLPLTEVRHGRFWKCVVCDGAGRVEQYSVRDGCAMVLPCRVCRAAGHVMTLLVAHDFARVDHFLQLLATEPALTAQGFSIDPRNAPPSRVMIVYVPVSIEAMAAGEDHVFGRVLNGKVVPCVLDADAFLDLRWQPVST